MLAPEELASLRAVAQRSLSGKCTVLRIERQQQPNNTWKDVQVPVYTNIKCRKVPSGQTPVELAIMDTTEGQKGISTFLLEGSLVFYSNDVVQYPVGGKKYNVAGIADRTDEIYSRVIVYDDGRSIP